MSHRTASALRMRKSPKQPRSRATVAAIVEATARVLGRRGWAGFTTEEVAQVAGVSIGSIYQYFPGRQMLLEAVRDRHFEQLISSLQTVRDDPGGVEQKARLLVEGLICAHAGDAGLHRVLLDEATALHVSQSAERLETVYREAISALVMAALPALRFDNSAEMTIVLGAALEAAVHQVAKAGRQQDAVMREALERLVLSYLRAPIEQ